ncbi:murein hydrolase activator EnvC family protein [Calderihabitans maritimus]|uniref:Membrane protein related to metalloendopeptidases n=1 Tax=Calderihabitans maritimus TaxID=1246530 RepID=A0A1Z5HUG0_9FIRM|nr:peptidoglycan DD-metalloendopeptidase family protein [Calderihabitans maritimus]GAW93173.1 membrane protein related to metalloendopeptidases [Calderihabitans maritimus]
MSRCRKYRLVLGLLTVLAFLGTLLIPVYGSELDRLKEQQRKINREIEEQKNIIEQKNRQIESLSEQVERLENDILLLTRELNDLRGQLIVAQKKVEQAEKELEEAEKKLAQLTDTLAARIKGIYMNGSVNYLEVLMQSTSITDFLIRYDFMQKIVEQDIQLIRQVETERKKIEARKADLEVKRDEIALLKKETEDKKRKLEGRKKEQERILTAIRTEKEAALRALEEKEKASKLIAAKIREIQARLKRQRAGRGGRFTWPTPGYTRITSDYGWRIHPILKTRRFHTGVDIAAPYGSPVVAVEDGIVIYAGWFGAYGNTVILDHGGGISTMYPHLSSYLVREGQEVRRGQTVGRIGSTGLSTGPHLHFEVRINGDPVNPWPYLR